MSPGRCALPSGMFSTRPMAPTALTFALRAASACIRPTTQAAPAMSPFMSSMPAAALIEMPPVSKQTPLPMKATGCSPRLPPFQRMITMRPGRVEPCATPSSAPMPSLVMALTSSTSTSTPSLRSWLGAAGEFLRIEHVRRLVDEFARHDDAVDDMGVGRERLARGGDVADRDRDVGPQGGLLAVLLFGLVAVELVGAQPHAGGDRGRLLGLHGAVRQFGHDRHRFVAGAQLAGGDAAEFEKVLLLEVRQLAGADHDQARDLEALRRQNIERGPALALELVGRRGPRDEIGRRAQRLAGRRAEFQRIVAEHHQNAARDGGKRNEADLDGVGHGQILQNQGCRWSGTRRAGLGRVSFGRDSRPSRAWFGPLWPASGRAAKRRPWPEGHITANY